MQDKWEAIQTRLKWKDAHNNQNEHEEQAENDTQCK